MIPNLIFVRRLTHSICQKVLPLNWPPPPSTLAPSKETAPLVREALKLNCLINWPPKAAAALTGDYETRKRQSGAALNWSLAEGKSQVALGGGEIETGPSRAGTCQRAEAYADSRTENNPHYFIKH